MNTLIFADVHLKVDPANRATLDEFTAFLRSVDPAHVRRVIIVGDLFDFWFEYKHAVFSGYFDVLHALARLRDAGVDMHLICGNHDFWAGRFFDERLGVRVHPDAYECELDGRRALFVHGDGVNPADKAYRTYKRFARWWVPVRLFSLLHPDWAMAIAQRVSHASRSRQDVAGAARLAEVEASRAFARAQIESGRADLVVCGHTHVAAYEEIRSPRGTGIYVNTGGWREDKAYWLWDGKTLRRYVGPVNAPRPAPISEARQEGQRVSLPVVDVAREEPGQS
jgi:UDP-2,3-diacylglucosamine hydrolase